MKNMMKGTKNTMFPHTIRQHIGPKAYLVLALMMLMACSGGGGGGGGGGDLLAGGGIGGTGITVGAITGFGSVIVNDVDYNTEDAEVIINGELIDTENSTVDSVLAIGMVVRVEAKYPTDGKAIAEQIVFSSNLNGPVQSITPIDSVGKILSILGQSVIIDDETQFEKNTTFNHIAENNVLEVSGWPDAVGRIHATYIKKIAETLEPDTEVRVKGIVTTIIDQLTFSINQLVVNISEIKNYPMPAAGQLVIVHGILDENGILVAGTLEIENELGVEDADNVDIEGIVSQVWSADEFILGSTAVQTDEATEFVGLTPDDIIPGARLLVKGALSQGVVLADEVKAKDKVDIEGRVATVHLNPGEITLSGLSPLVVRINSATKIFGEASELSEINPGQHVKILGYAAGMEYVVAGQVKVNKKERSKVKLQGQIGDIKINAPIISIFGVEIDVEQISEVGTAIPSDFLDQAAEGDRVNVMGNLDDDSVIWKEIELLNFEN